MFDNDITEAEAITDGADFLEDEDYYEYQSRFTTKQRNLAQERANRLINSIGKYVITCIGKSSGNPVYLQDKRISSGGYWTQYLSNARTFSNEKDAQSICSKYKYGNPHVIRVM